ncbi:hypothetical protein HYV64_00300 [Candidatus Shapirobacteria bacterium]|nr:hypothetical protein [Candidatus Shapirobacteria bacterium]
MVRKTVDRPNLSENIVQIIEKSGEYGSSCWLRAQGLMDKLVDEGIVTVQAVGLKPLMGDMSRPGHVGLIIFNKMVWIDSGDGLGSATHDISPETVLSPRSILHNGTYYRVFEITSDRQEFEEFVAVHNSLSDLGTDVNELLVNNGTDPEMGKVLWKLQLLSDKLEHFFGVDTQLSQESQRELLIMFTDTFTKTAKHNLSEHSSENMNELLKGIIYRPEFLLQMVIEESERHQNYLHKTVSRIANVQSLDDVNIRSCDDFWKEANDRFKLWENYSKNITCLLKVGHPIYSQSTPKELVDAIQDSLNKVLLETLGYIRMYKEEGEN